MLVNQVTAVIATIGKDKLDYLIDKLTKEIAIKDIFICVPRQAKPLRIKIKSKKISVIFSNYKHQVKQRILGLKYCRTQFVVFFDDDINFNNNFFKNLVKSKIFFGKNSVIAPVYYDIKTKKKIHDHSNDKKSLLKKVLHLLLFGSSVTVNRMGKISRSGICYGVDPDYIKNYHQSEWIPGGCIMLNTNKMIRTNYFYLNGKAFCEDLILSVLLRKKGMKLFVKKNCKVFTDAPQKIARKKDLISYINGLNLLFKLLSKNYHFYLWRYYLLLKLYLKSKI